MAEVTKGTWAIIPCTNQKSRIRGPAREVWIGNHFQLVLAHAEMFYETVFVLSYKYGFIKPDFVIDPYDVNMRTASAGDRLQWWLKVRDQIHELAKEEPRLVSLYTGNFERDRLIREFVRAGQRNVIIPWSDATVGRRMQLVYDGIPPFDPEAIDTGEYALPANYGEPKKRGRKPKNESSIDPNEEIAWESE